MTTIDRLSGRTLLIGCFLLAILAGLGCDSSRPSGSVGRPGVAQPLDPEEERVMEQLRRDEARLRRMDADLERTKRRARENAESQRQTRERHELWDRVNGPAFGNLYR